jgi:hypothetical protein
MRFDKKFKLEKVCSKDKTRWSILQQPHLDVERQRLLACNGFVLAVVPATVDGDDKTGAIPLDAFKAAAKSKLDPELSAAVHVNGGTVKVEDANATLEFVVPQGAIGKYPDVDQIIPREKDDDIVIGLDAKLLYELAQAMHPQGGGRSGYKVALRIQRLPNSPVTVKPVFDRKQYNEAFGVIMPVHVA